ncbi:MAG: lasso peptide isopeptide bond-forming cyclase [Actinomycetota bacterium]|nr:lasso peptide isopeptide bond-forming cyclase [Actinomycetota bacterium]
MNPGGIRHWFVVLPDCSGASSAAAALRPWLTSRIAHGSGRPWILGRFDDHAVAVGVAGETKVAVIGDHAATDNDLSDVARRIRTVGDIDRFVASLVGSAHVVVSVPGNVRVQGSVTCLRQVFHARLGRVSVAADRADILAAIAGTPLDTQRLAVHLLDSPALHPLAGHPVWRGVEALPGDRYLVLEAEGRNRLVKWWAPPEPIVPMAEGASYLRDALRAAVDARARGRDVVSCDLGGLDSTTLCCLAARCDPKVLAYTADGHDPMGEDVLWARRTVAALGNVEHHVIAGDEVPMPYGGVRELDHWLDEPSAAAPHCNRYLFIPRLAAAQGSRLHLTGFGGDELLAGSPAHLHSLLRTHPRTALRHARGFATQRPWSYRETLRQLLDRRPYRAWFAGVADQLTAPLLPVETPTLHWGVPPRMPPWSTPEAVGAVRDLVAAAAPKAEPLATGRGQHIELLGLRTSARMVRLLNQMASRDRISLAAPYYDDRVVEAGLAIRPEERITPWEYKPLIVEAMRGFVPDEALRRHTKDGGSHEVEVGLREHRADLLALCEDSRLGRLGLIDPNAFRDVCSRPLGLLPFDVLYQTVACELWLRALETATVPS